MITLALILLAFAVGSAVTAWYVRRWAYRLGYRTGAHDIDDLRAELHDVEQQIWTLGQQQQRRAA